MGFPVPDLPVTDPVLIVAITMGILLLGPLVFERFKIPGLVGLIALGAMAGPSVTGLLERDATFELLGTFGLLYLMFVAGVTLDLGEFSKARKAAVGFGALSFGVPMALAVGVGRLLGFGGPASVLLGSIVGSHTLLALPIAQRLGIAKTRSLVVATGATLVTDLLSLLVLAVVVGLVSGDAGAAYWLRFAGLSALWGVAVLWGLPKLARAFFRRVRREDDIAFAFLLAAVFFSAWLAELVGLAAIIGAFLAGIALNRLIPKQSPLMTRLRFVGDAFLVPFFLVSVGLLVDVAVLGSLDVWRLALSFLGLVVVGKGAAAMLGRGLFAFSKHEAVAILGLTIPQAAATLAVTLIGFDLGLFSQTAVNAVVVLIAVSCLIGPLLVTRGGRALAQAAASGEARGAGATERYVVLLSNPETSDALMELALLMRSASSEEAVYPLTVADDGPGEQANVAAGERLMERAVLHATAADVPCTPLVRIDANPTSGITRGVREIRASAVVAGWNDTLSPGTVVFGSVLDGVVAQTRAMMVLARLAAPLAGAKRLVVLVPPRTRLEAGFPRAVRAMLNLAQQKGLGLVVLGAADEAHALEAAFAGPSAPRVVALPDWRAAIGTLDEQAARGDVLALLAVRAGALAWRPSIQRLPRVLPRRFPALDVLTVYLSEAEVAEGVAEALDGDGDEDLELPAEHIQTDLAPATPEVMLQRMLYDGFPEQPGTAARLARDLAAAAESAPEVMAGVVFYHAHTYAVEAPMVFVGVCPRGAALPQAAGPARVLLALLAPQDMPPDAYLRLLSVVAQMVKSEATVEALLAADAPEAARDVLFDGLRDGLDG